MFQRRLILYHIVYFVSTGNFHSVKMFISLSALSLCDEKYYIRFCRILQGGFLKKFSRRFSGDGLGGSRYLALALWQWLRLQQKRSCEITILSFSRSICRGGLAAPIGVTGKPYPSCLSCHSHPIRPFRAPSPRGEGYEVKEIVSYVTSCFPLRGKCRRQ